MKGFHEVHLILIDHYTEWDDHLLDNLLQSFRFITDTKLNFGMAALLLEAIGTRER